MYLLNVDPTIFDTQFALSQFSGNHSLLNKMLEKFQLQYQHTEKQYDKLFAQSDFQSVKTHIHTLKGISGNLGMKALYIAAKKFETQLANHITESDIKVFFSTLHNTLEVIVNFISNTDNEIHSGAVVEPSNKQALIMALKRNEFISDDKMQRFMQEFDIEPDVKDKLIQAINNLDYATALRLIN